jgi:hypothetical protein
MPEYIEAAGTSYAARTPPRKAGVPTYVLPPEAADQTAFINVSWLQRAIAFGQVAFDVDHLTQVVSDLEVDMHAGRFELLGRLIAGFPFESVSPQVTITVLRVTSAARLEIPRWATAVDRAAACLEAQGIDTVRILRGLR